MASIKLVSINIERSKHLDAVAELIRTQKPDVVTLQECMERDLPFWEEVVGMGYFFTPQSIFGARHGEAEGLEGQVIFARNIISSGFEYYAGEYDPIYRTTDDKVADIIRIAKALSHVVLEHEGGKFCVATTHFTWSPGGKVTELQLTDLASLLAKLEKLPDVILTGDFNAPRGRKTWDTLAAKYKDNVPQEYTSSIDPMHRAGPLPYVVDGVFTTPEYSVSNVELHEGVSDHKAISATITRL
jgi:endonuclease/exonuclease/phosphatase family metal-dependent hydrolase